jgi:hypothetical protein
MACTGGPGGGTSATGGGGLLAAVSMGGALTFGAVVVLEMPPGRLAAGATWTLAVSLCVRYPARLATRATPHSVSTAATAITGPLITSPLYLGE